MHKSLHRVNQLIASYITRQIKLVSLTTMQNFSPKPGWFSHSYNRHRHFLSYVASMVSNINNRNISTQYKTKQTLPCPRWSKYITLCTLHVCNPTKAPRRKSKICVKLIDPESDFKKSKEFFANQTWKDVLKGCELVSGNY